MTDQKSLSLKKTNQPKAIFFLSEAERAVIKQSVAKNLTEAQFSVFIYTCQALGLNPLVNEITPIVFGGTMSIVTMRDGFLTIAHRSGKFKGIESGTKYDEEKNLIGWAKVYHADFTVPVYQEADFKEYTTGRNLWTTKPKTMIKKVAESMALRKAFNISGTYSQEELDKEIIEKPKPEEIAGSKERERIITYINESKGIEELKKCEEYLGQDEELIKLFNDKISQIKEQK